MSDFLPDCMIGPSEPCKGFTQMQDRLRAELANLHKWNREAVAAYKAKEAELAAANARIAELDGQNQQMFTANCNLANDLQAARERIAELERCRDNAENALESQQKWHLQMTAEFRETSNRDNTALEAAKARIAELEAAGNRLGDAAVEGALTSIEAVTELAETKARIASLEEELASTRFNFTGLRNATTARIAELEAREQNHIEVANRRLARAERAEAALKHETDCVEAAKAHITDLEEIVKGVHFLRKQAEAELKVMREALELVDADVRHHLRSDAIDHALLRKNAVAAVRAALAPSPAEREG